MGMEEERNEVERIGGPGDSSFYQDEHVGKTTVSGRMGCPEIRVHEDRNTPPHILWAGVRKEGTNGIAAYRIRASEVARAMVASSRGTGRVHMTGDGSHSESGRRSGGETLSCEGSGTGWKTKLGNECPPPSRAAQARQLRSPMSFHKLLQSVGHPKPLEANGGCANGEAKRKFLRLPQQYRHTSVFGLGTVLEVTLEAVPVVVRVGALGVVLQASSSRSSSKSSLSDDHDTDTDDVIGDVTDDVISDDDDDDAGAGDVTSDVTDDVVIGDDLNGGHVTSGVSPVHVTPEGGHVTWVTLVTLVRATLVTLVRVILVTLVRVTLITLVTLVRVEAQFQLHRITSQTTKYLHVVPSLQAELAYELEDILAAPATSNQYDLLKAAILARKTPSERSRLQHLLNMEELGDQRPSQILGRMRELMGDVTTDADTSLLRELFLQRLPHSMVPILAAAEDMPLDQLANLAARVLTSLRATAPLGAVTKGDAFPYVPEPSTTVITGLHVPPGIAEEDLPVITDCDGFFDKSIVVLDLPIFFEQGTPRVFVDGYIGARHFDCVGFGAGTLGDMQLTLLLFTQIRYTSCDANSFFKEQLDAAFQKSFTVHGIVGYDGY
ncbi:hypothetical protein ISCGN_026930 [Ixodes scapularis]